MSEPARRAAIARSALLFAVGAAFAAWAGWFVYESSFVGHDGVRRFCLFDDAMISMRYAWNLAHGEGLVWNPGERVEGFTNLLWTLYMTIWTGLLSKSAAVLAVQISGGALALAAGFFAALVAERLAVGTELEGDPLVPALALAAAVFYYPLAYWSLMGMETGLLAALLTAAVWAALRADGDARPALVVPVLLGLAFLTRPDAAIGAALVLGCRALGLWRRPGWLRALAVEAAVLAAFVAAASIFRLAYYGSLTPNTYLLKMTGLELAFRLENGLGFLEPFFESAALPLGLIALAAVVDGSRPKLLIAALALAAVGYQIWVGGDPWRYWRQIAPVMPLATALVVVELALLLRRRLAGTALERFGRLRFAPPPAVLRGALLVGLVWIVAAALNERFEQEQWFEKPPYTVKSNRANVGVALALRDLARPGATVGVTWAGAIPYYTGLRAVDFLGKSDPHIASLPPDTSGRVGWKGMKSVPGHNKYDLEYSIKERRPTFIQTFKWGRQNLRRWVREHYRTVRHLGVGLRLERGSEHIDWSKLGRRREADGEGGR